MTVQNDSNVKTYTGNGVTTVFPYDFFIPGDSATDQSNVEVTLLTIATGAEGAPLSTSLWSITGVGTDSYGNVTYTGAGTPLPATHKINIRRVVPLEQNLNLTTQSAYFPELLEEQLDLIVFQIQQLAEETGRAVKVAVGSTDSPDEIIDSLLAAAAAAEAAKTAAELAETNAETAEANAAASAADAATSAAQAGTGSFTRYKWTATAGQTSFTGATATPALTTDPAGKAACTVNVNGRILLDEEYSLSGVNFTLGFDDIEAGEIVEITVATSDVLNTVSNGAITLPKLDSGTLPTLISLEGLSLAQGDVLYATAADTLARLPKGTALQILRMNSGATAPEWVTQNGRVTRAVQTLSGVASRDELSIPSWVTCIEVMFQDVSFGDGSHFRIQIGDSGGIETSGYDVRHGYEQGGVSPTYGQVLGGFSVYTAAAGNILTGKATLTLLDPATNTWQFNAQAFITSSTTILMFSSGIKSLSAALDRLQINGDNGTNFDGGKFSIAYS